MSTTSADERVALEHDPPPPGAVVATLPASAVAVGLAGLCSEVVGTEARARRRVGPDAVRHMLDDVGAGAFGIAFPSVFFLLAVVGVFEDDAAFTLAKWTGLGLIGFYGFCAGRLIGASVTASMLHALVVGAIGGALIAIKALIH